MVRYATEPDGSLLDPVELSEQLTAVLRNAMPWLVTISEDEASVPEREGKWSAKQVVGHLIDSAVNNLARIVRLQIEADQSLPGYEQMAWVSLQHYAEREWAQVLALWFALNEHLAWTIGCAEKVKLKNHGVIAGEHLTLGFLVADYIAHMDHPLSAMRLWLGIAGKAQR
jgi:DinB superfamily